LTFDLVSYFCIFTGDTRKCWVRAEFVLRTTRLLDKSFIQESINLNTKNGV